MLITLQVFAAHNSDYRDRLYYVAGNNLYAFNGSRLNAHGYSVKDVAAHNGRTYWIESRRGETWLVRDQQGRQTYQAWDMDTAALNAHGNNVYVSDGSRWGDIYGFAWGNTHRTGMMRFGATAFDVNDRYIVWHESDALYRRSITGSGGITRLVYVPACKAVAIQGDWVYYIHAFPECISRVRLSGGRSEIIFDAREIDGIPTDLDTDATHLYFSTNTGIYRSHFDGYSRYRISRQRNVKRITVDGYQRPVRRDVRRTRTRWVDVRNCD
jgi:hypothetical protein